MKCLLRKIVHLCGGIMPDEIITKAPPMKVEKSTMPIRHLRVSFTHHPDAPSEYIDNDAVQLLGRCIIDNQLVTCDTTVDFPTGMVTRNYEIYVADPHLND